jgi:hypothetical protein
MPGFLIIAAAIIVLLCIYSFIFRKEAIAAFPPLIRYIFWAYFLISLIIVIWGAIDLIMNGF